MATYRHLGDLQYNGKYVGKEIYPLPTIKEVRVPNPTIFWVLDPEIHKQIAHLEKDGLIKQIEKRIADDRELQEKLVQQHQEYRDYRWSLLTPEDREYVKRNGWLGKFDSGIGGILEPRHVRCLHLHFAHYCFNGQNEIGRIVDQHLRCLPQKDKL